MKLHTATSWNEMFLRTMQSWADTALWFGSGPDEIDLDDRCFLKSCSRNELISFAITHDETVTRWPHLMGHMFGEVMLELRWEIQNSVIRRPHYSATVRDYFVGSGLIPVDERSVEMQEAVDAMALNMQAYDIWIHDRLLDLGDWPLKVYHRLHGRVRDWQYMDQG